MTNCAYVYGRECDSRCNAYNPWSRKQCSRLDDDGKIADALEAIAGILIQLKVDDANRS
jgi:hypothetical protein